MLAPITGILLFHLAWFLIGVPITRFWVRASWDPAFKPGEAALAGVWLARMLHGIAPLVAIVFALIAWSPANLGATSPYAALSTGLVLLLLPLLLGHVLLLRSAVRLKRAYARDSDPSHLLLGMRASLRGSQLLGAGLIVLYLCGWSRAGQVPFYGMLVVVFVGRHLLLTKILPGADGSRSARIEMPDLPLRKEMLALLQRSALSNWKIVVQPQRCGGDPFQRSTLVGDSRLFGRKLIVPLPMLLSVDPQTYTALLACELIQGRPISRERSLQSRRVLGIGCAVLAAGWFGFQSLAKFATDLPHGFDWILVVVWVIGLWVGFMLLRKLAQQPSYARCRYRAAYLNWHDAAPEADRTVEEFVAALAEGEAVRECIRDPEVLVHRLRQDWGLMEFLDLCGPEIKERALALISSRSSDDEEPRSAEVRPPPLPPQGSAASVRGG